MAALILSLVVFTAAFIAEIVRAGVQAVPHGQSEAALALGLHRSLMMKLVVIPQALRLIVPPLTSQYLNVVKNSSLAVFVGYPDLVQIFAGTVLNQTQAAVQVMSITMAVYLFISLMVAAALNAFNASYAWKRELAWSNSNLCSIRARAGEPPPVLLRGPVAWARDNLFSSIASGLTTLTFVALAIRLLPPMIAWATTLAVWNAPDGALCRQHQDGACWAFIAAKLDYLRFGSYPASERWRVDLVEALGASLIVWLLWPKAPCRGWAAALFFAVYPVLTLALLRGSEALRLPIVDVLLWGGMLVSFLTAIVGIVFSLPLGVVLALGRRSQMPVVRLPASCSSNSCAGFPSSRSYSWPIPCCRYLYPKLGRQTAFCVLSSASLYFPRPIWRRKFAGACNRWVEVSTRGRWRWDWTIRG